MAWRFPRADGLGLWRLASGPRKTAKSATSAKWRLLREGVFQSLRWRTWQRAPKRCRLAAVVALMPVHISRGVLLKNRARSFRFEEVCPTFKICRDGVSNVDLLPCD